MRYCLVAVIILLLQELLCGQTESQSERYVARAGNTYISEYEFIQRFEMLPALNRRKSALEVDKLELLYSMIAEKLLAEEALDRKLDQDSLFQAATLEIRKMLVRDQLYREEIANAVKITPQETREGIAKALREVHVAFLYFDREADAQFIRAQLRKPGDFESLVIDSSIAFLRDTATIIWGDAQLEIEDAAYRLKEREISGVVKSGSGFYLLQCLRNSPNTAYTTLSGKTLTERVTKRLRERKEREAHFQFIAEFLKDKTGYSKPEPFKQLAQALLEEFRTHQSASDSMLSLNSEIAKRLHVRCATFLNDSFVVAGKTVWSLEEIISRLHEKGFSVSKENVGTIPALLRDEIGFMVRQELLGQEGLKRGLDQRLEVKRKIEMWTSSYLADLMKRRALLQQTVTDEEFWKYLRYLDSNSVMPLVQLRELRTSALDEMRQALGELQRGEKFESVIVKWSNDSQAKLTKGVTPFFAITERAPLGTLAAKMKVGERYGPIRVADSVFFFELIAKKNLPSQTDTSFAAHKAKAERDLLQMKYKRTLNLFLAQVADKRGFEIYQDRLKQIEVTPLPMMTFRLLGFGGRMFEVPFVDPQLEWIDIEPPKETILP